MGSHSPLKWATLLKNDVQKIQQSFIKDTTIEAQIVEWKKKILPSACESDDKEDHSTTTHLGIKYWRNFLKRQPQIASKKAVRFNSNHDDWCTHQRFLAIYEMVYSAVVKSGVAIKLDHKVWLDSKGAITENKDELLTYPSKAGVLCWWSRGYHVAKRWQKCWRTFF